MTACPHCGVEDSLEVLVEALTVYPFKGFADGTLNGFTYENGYERVDEFDDVKVVCRECGEDVIEDHFTKRLEADDSHLVIKFGVEADQLIQHVASTLSNTTVIIEYRVEENPLEYPINAVLRTGNDDGIIVCHQGECGEPLLGSQVFVKYDDIKSITII